MKMPKGWEPKSFAEWLRDNPGAEVLETKCKECDGTGAVMCGTCKGIRECCCCDGQGSEESCPEYEKQLKHDMDRAKEEMRKREGVK